MPCMVVIGGFFGDEGKGKVISYLASRDKPSIMVRGGAGPNAGHTIIEGGKTFKVRMLPSGFLNAETRVMIGAGVVVDPRVFLDEVREFDVHGRAFVDRNAGVIEEDHIRQDGGGRLKEKIGSTGSGTGPANAARAMRTLRLAGQTDLLKPHTTDVAQETNDALDAGKMVLVEGTQGTFLSLFHGTYPFVTSKDVTASGICADIGIGPTRIDDVMIVFKAYVTRVGTGPLPGEMSAEESEARGWSEFGTVTGRPRRAAEFDYGLAKRAVMLNGATQMAVTKLDVVFPGSAGKTSFDDLDDDARRFILDMEERLGLAVTIIGTGPAVADVIDRRDVIRKKTKNQTA